jgi:hypothetical protein
MRSARPIQIPRRDPEPFTATEIHDLRCSTVESADAPFRPAGTEALSADQLRELRRPPQRHWWQHLLG